MTLRERLADWLTGGALTKARDGEMSNAKLDGPRRYEYREGAIDITDSGNDGYQTFMDDPGDFGVRSIEASVQGVLDDTQLEPIIKLMIAQDTLRRIAACETPGANATVRRMAKMAQEAVE